MDILSKQLLYRILPTDWIQPTLTQNGTFGGSQMAVDWTHGGANGTGGIAYQAFQPNTGYLYLYGDEYRTWMKIFIYTPVPVKATAISFTNWRVNDTSGWAMNVMFYGGNAKDSNTEVLCDIGSWIGDSPEGAITTRGISTNNYYQYFTLYLETYGSAYNDSIAIGKVKLSGLYEDFI